MMAIVFEGKRVVMCMVDEIHAKRDEIYAIARIQKAEKHWAFCSYARGAQKAMWSVLASAAEIWYRTSRFTRNGLGFRW